MADEIFVINVSKYISSVLIQRLRMQLRRERRSGIWNRWRTEEWAVHY